MKKETCRRARKRLYLYSQNLLDAGPASEVKAHLLECPSCRKTYDETREVLALLKADFLPDPGPVFWSGLSARVMTQVRLLGSAEKEEPWYKKIRINPFSWPGYGWATALILMLLTPVVIYNIHFQDNKIPSIQEINGHRINGETESMPLSAAVESLSDKESVRLAQRMVARMGKDLPGSTQLLIDSEMHWDVSRTLEVLNSAEIETLIKKMEPGGSAGYRGEEEYAC